MTLRYIKNKLEAVEGLLVSERGSGKAKFLYVSSPTRAIEIHTEAGNYFIEYWDTANEDSDSAPVHRDEVASEADAVTNIIQWLCAK